MSINRVDFQGAIVRTSDIVTQKANEDNKGLMDQSNFQSQFHKEIDNRTNTVTEPTQTEKQQHEKHDAKEKGDNEYRGDGGQKRNLNGKSPEELKKLGNGLIGRDGKQVDLGISSGFDFKV